MPLLKPKVQDYQERQPLPNSVYRFQVKSVEFATTKNVDKQPVPEGQGHPMIVATLLCTNPPMDKPYWAEIRHYMIYEFADGYIQDPTKSDMRQNYMEFCQAIKENPAHTNTDNWIGMELLGEVLQSEDNRGSMRANINKVAAIG